MTSGSLVCPSALRPLIAGTVSRRIGCGVGFARLVAVSSWKVVDIGDGPSPATQAGKAPRIALALTDAALASRAIEGGGPPTAAFERGKRVHATRPRQAARRHSGDSGKEITETYAR